MDNFELAHECLDSAYGSSSCDERMSGRLAEITAAVESLETATAELQQQIADENFILLPIPEVPTFTKAHLLNDTSFYWRNKNFNNSSSSMDSLAKQEMNVEEGKGVLCKFEDKTSLSSSSDSEDELNCTLLPDIAIRSVRSPRPLSIMEQKRNLFMLASQRELIERYADQSESSCFTAESTTNVRSTSRARAKARAKAPIGGQLRPRKANGRGIGGGSGGRRGRSYNQPHNRSVRKIRKLMHDGGGDADGGIDGDDDATPPASARQHCSSCSCNGNSNNNSYDLQTWIFYLIILIGVGYVTLQNPLELMRLN